MIRLLQSESDKMKDFMVPDSVQKAQLQEAVEKITSLDIRQALTNMLDEAGWIILKIVLAVLNPDDVAAILCSLCKMVYIFLLLQSKIVPTMNLISHDLEICELIDKILEVLVLSIEVRTRNQSGTYASDCQHFSNKFHIV